VVVPGESSGVLMWFVRREDDSLMPVANRATAAWKAQEWGTSYVWAPGGYEFDSDNVMEYGSDFNVCRLCNQVSFDDKWNDDLDVCAYCAVVMPS